MRDGGAAVGYVQASVNNLSAEIAWVIGLRWQGNGHAQAATGAMCDWLRRGAESES